MFTNALNVFVTVALAAIGASAAPLQAREAAPEAWGWNYPSFSSSAFNAQGSQSSDSTTVKTPNTFFHNDNAEQESSWDSSSVYSDPHHFSSSNAAAQQESESHNTQFADTNGNSLNQHSDSSSWSSSSSNVNVNHKRNWGNYYYPSFGSSAYNAQGSQSSDSTTVNTPNSWFHNDNQEQESSWDSSSVYYDPHHYSSSNAAAEQESESHNTQYADNNGNSLNQHSDSSSWSSSYNNVNANYKRWNWNDYYRPSFTSSSYDAAGTQSHDSTSINTPNTHFDNTKDYEAEAFRSSSAYANSHGFGNANSNGAQWDASESTNFNDHSGNSLHQDSSNSGYNYHSDSSNTSY